MVGVEVRQRHQRQDLAVARIHHDAGRRLGLELAHRRAQFVAHQMLHPHIDGQAQRPVAFREMVLEPFFQPGDAAVVAVHIAQQMRHQRALRIDAGIFVDEVQAGNAALQQRPLLARRQMPAQPHEAAVGFKLLQRRLVFQVGQNLGQRPRRLFRVQQAPRIGV